MSHHEGSDLQNAIQHCWTCRTTCMETFYDHCLAEGGDHVAPDHVKLMMDCIEICQLSADFMTRHSANHHAVCAACATICEACGKSCEAMESGIMKKCAAECYRCAASCRKMGDVKKAA